MELTAGWTDSEDLHNIFLPLVRCLRLTEALSPTPALSGLYHGLGLSPMGGKSSFEPQFPHM